MSDTPPEVALAQFILRDEGFFPGDNLQSLVSRFATVEFTPIPFRADGISIKLKVAERPHIVINSDNPPTRQKFTLAHELGHVLIPWHVGTICSHIDGNIDQESEYYQQEGEANRFASELLVPSGWVRVLFDDSNDPAKILKKVISTVNISPMAAAIKLMQCLPPGFVCTEDYQGMSTQYHRSPGTAISAPYAGDLAQIAQYDSMADSCFSLDYRGYSYRWWFLDMITNCPKSS